LLPLSAKVCPQAAAVYNLAKSEAFLPFTACPEETSMCLLLIAYMPLNQERSAYSSLYRCILLEAKEKPTILQGNVICFTKESCGQAWQQGGARSPSNGGQDLDQAVDILQLDPALLLVAMAHFAHLLVPGHQLLIISHLRDTPSVIDEQVHMNHPSSSLSSIQPCCSFFFYISELLSGSFHTSADSAFCHVFDGHSEVPDLTSGLPSWLRKWSDTL
jgi:hypothetical protein